jgi:hypothetical protein
MGWRSFQAYSGGNSKVEGNSKAKIWLVFFPFIFNILSLTYIGSFFSLQTPSKRDRHILPFILSKPLGFALCWHLSTYPKSYEISPQTHSKRTFLR